MDKKILEVALRVKTPVTLTAFALVILYALYQLILGQGIFSNLDQDKTFSIINTLISYVFIVALVTLVLGIVAHTYERTLDARGHNVHNRLAITGNVLFSDGLPVPGAHISVDGIDRHKISDSTGWFQIEVSEQRAPWQVRAIYGKYIASITVKRTSISKPVTIALAVDGREGKPTQARRPASVLPEATQFDTLDTFEEKKINMILPRQGDIQAGKFRLTEDEVQRCRESPWDWDRIVLYLCEEFSLKPKS